MRNTHRELCILFVLLVLPVTAESDQAFRDTGLVCAVDMGSSTFKFIVAEIKNGKYLQYTDDRRAVGVGDDINASEKQTGQEIISDGKIKEIKSLVKEFQNECERKTRSRKILGIATAAFRDAKNGEAISRELSEQGVELTILSEELESIYAYDAATAGESGFAVVDPGSRTTEFVSKSGNTYQWSLVRTGYKSAWDAFYNKAETFSQASNEHHKQLKELVGEKEKEILQGQTELRMIEMGETLKYVLNVPKNEMETKVTRAQVMKELHELDAESFADLKANFKDAARVLPRLVLIDFILEGTGYDQFRAMDRELNVAIVYHLARSETK